MSLFSEMVVEEGVTTTSFQTNSLLDYATGSYVLGHDGKWYITGGLPQHIIAVVGPNGAYKSTFAAAMIMRSANIYYDADVLIDDTEDSLDKDKKRALLMGEDLYRADIENRVLWLPGSEYTLDKLYKFIYDLCMKKSARKKDFLVKSPYIDFKTGEPLEIWVPTYIFIDSLTELYSDAEDELINNGKKGLSDANTAMMLDGNKKTLLIRSLKTLCMKYGLIVVVTGHFDKVVQMGMFDVTPKDTTFSKQDWKTKGVGSKLKFNASLYIRTQTSILQDSDKEPEYGIGSGSFKDVMEVQVVVERSKTACAGTVLPFVATQSTGILNAVTNYHYLRRMNEYDGLVGNKQRHHVGLVPNITLTRNTVRELTEGSYELRRALEIAAQYCYIKNNWRTDTLPVDFGKSANEVFDILMSDKNKGMVSDIVNSRGYWTYCKSDRPYMDLFEIMRIAGLVKPTAKVIDIPEKKKAA